jgi:outer membrane protein assembly factor BamB
VWAFETGSPLSASPAIAAGRVVIGSQDGRLYCFG